MPGITFEDLDEAQQAKVRKAIKIALCGIADARVELERAKHHPSARVRKHFKIYDRQDADLTDLSRIIGRYHLIAEALRGNRNLHFDGEMTGPYLVGSVVAYVWSKTPPERGQTGVVKLVRSGFFRRDGTGQARVLIHEVGHRFAGLDLDRYHDAAGYARLTRDEALRNADTYAYFALPGPQIPSLRVDPPRPGSGS